ncbi:ribonuclease H-like domain-containing protein [Tanacetum coccineum]
MKLKSWGHLAQEKNTQNVAFVSSNSIGSTNEAVKTAQGVYVANSKANALTLPNVDSLSDVVIYSFFARNRLKVADGMLTMRARRFLKTGRNLGVNGTDTIGFDKTNVECYNCHRRGHFARDYKAPRNQDSRNREPTKRTMPVEETTSKALVLQDLQAQTLSQVFDSQVNDRYKTGKGYHVVPPPYTGNFMPPKPDLVLTEKDEYVFSKSVTSVPAAATSEVKTSESRPKFVSEPLIEDWVSDSENKNETGSKSRQRKPSIAKIEFVKSSEHVKSPREFVKKVENSKQANYPRKNNQSPKGNKRNCNNLMTHKLGSNFEFKNKACFVCGSFNHLIKDCDFYEKKMVEKPIWNNARRVNHQNSQRMTHPHPKGNFVPRAILMKYGLKTLNTAYPRPTVNSAKTASNVFNRAHSHGDPQLELQEKGVIDSGCSRHMTRNKSYLSDYVEIDGGFVSFGGNSKGGEHEDFRRFDQRQRYEDKY